MEIEFPSNLNEIPITIGTLTFEDKNVTCAENNEAV